MEKIKDAKKFASELCNWYRDNKRDLPFRHTRDPYKIFISELMLQQTQVDTVIPYYTRFIDVFPTPQKLAEAREMDVLKLWEGLGYYRRARYIHETAKMITNEYNGVFPHALKDIESLKGVGRYTARAIHSIAYNEPSAAVDGNVMRVMSRVTLFNEDIMKTKSMRTVERMVDDLIVHERPRDFTQAMMELGALICVKTPKCDACPVSKHCAAFKTNQQSAYPLKAKAKDKTHEHFTVFVVKKEASYFLVKRKSTGLLANMLEFPQFKVDVLDEAKKKFEKKSKKSVLKADFIGSIDHVFSHKIWHMNIYTVDLANTENLPLYNKDTMQEAMSKAHLKIFDLLKKTV